MSDEVLVEYKDANYRMSKSKDMPRAAGEGVLPESVVTEKGWRALLIPAEGSGSVLWIPELSQEPENDLDSLNQLLNEMGVVIVTG